MLEEQEIYLRLPEAAAYLGVSPLDIAEYVLHGQLAATTSSGVVMISEVELSRFLGAY